MIPLPLLFEDDDLLIVDKPAGLVVHPTYKNPDGTLLDALAARHIRGIRGTRPSVVGRLDKFTSGIVVIAKRPDIHAALQRTLASTDSDKIYLALVHGTADPHGTIDLPLASDPSDRRRRIVSVTGAPSVTTFERLDTATLAGYPVSLIRCRIATGRRHQIRVHVASRGWPIVGDTVYGTALDGFPRLALHAWHVAFDQPLSGERIAVTCPPPAELESLFARCGLSGRQSYATPLPQQTSRR